MPAEPAPPRAQLDAAVAAIRRALEPHAIAGVYLYGSAVAGGLRPDSDLDLLVLADRPMRRDEKAHLVDGLRPISRRSVRPSGWRPLEVTVVYRGDVRPWRYPPRFELQYGEWLTDEALGEQLTAGSASDPDVAVLLAMAHAHGRPLAGPPLDQVLDPVPPEDLIDAIRDEMPGLLDDLQGDTRNVLLTLARAWATVATGAIISKDAAAEWALARLPPAHRPLLGRARDLYLGGGYGDWAAEIDVAGRLAEAMAAEVRGAP